MSFLFTAGLCLNGDGFIDCEGVCDIGKGVKD